MALQKNEKERIENTTRILLSIGFVASSSGGRGGGRGGGGSLFRG